MTISVSTCLASAAMPTSAVRMRRWPSNSNGFVTTATVSTPSSFAVRAMIGAAPVPVPPPMPAVMNRRCTPSRWERMSSSASSAAAAPISGRDPAPRPSVMPDAHLDDGAGAGRGRACASVLAAMNSTPSRPLSIMLFTALPPAPPTPMTVMRGRNSVSPGSCRFIPMTGLVASYSGFMPAFASSRLRGAGVIENSSAAIG